jgi:probable rRNA maturation factor
VTITLSAPRGLGRLAPAMRALVRAALAGEARRAGEIGIVLAGDAELRALNRRWRGLDRATDVLSFGYGEPGAGRGETGCCGLVSGDLVISLDRVHAQALRYRVSRGRELARLVVHGALHLAGLDHKQPAERKSMRLREDRALADAVTTVRALDRLLGPVRRRG